MNGLVLTSITFLIFIVLHSITASLFFKSWAQSLLGEQGFKVWYRFLYNLLSVILLVPVFIELSSPSLLLWSASGTFRVLFYVLQTVSVIGIVTAFLQIDGWSFLGIRQLFNNYRSKHRYAEQLVIGGLYKVVRHPLYFFSLLFIWFVPSMTESWLVFSLFSTIYFYIGSYFEERKMVIQFGSVYKEYQQRVPRMIPFLKRTPRRKSEITR